MSSLPSSVVELFSVGFSVMPFVVLLSEESPSVLRRNFVSGKPNRIMRIKVPKRATLNHQNDCQFACSVIAPAMIGPIIKLPK